MSEELNITKGATREELYQEVIPQIKALIDNEPDPIANMANLAAVLREVFGFFWVGFYLVKEEQLVLGPFQGPLACTRINKGKGVCGTAWERSETILVEDVDRFPGHIACSSLSRSEIVVPIILNGEVYGVLDVDSEQVADFSEVDKEGLEAITKVLTDRL